MWRLRLEEVPSNGFESSFLLNFEPTVAVINDTHLL